MNLRIVTLCRLVILLALICVSLFPEKKASQSLSSTALAAPNKRRELDLVAVPSSWCLLTPRGLHRPAAVGAEAFVHRDVVEAAGTLHVLPVVRGPTAVAICISLSAVATRPVARVVRIAKIVVVPPIGSSVRPARWQHDGRPRVERDLPKGLLAVLSDTVLHDPEQ